MTLKKTNDDILPTPFLYLVTSSTFSTTHLVASHTQATRKPSAGHDAPSHEDDSLQADLNSEVSL